MTPAVSHRRAAGHGERVCVVLLMLAVCVSGCEAPDAAQGLRPTERLPPERPETPGSSYRSGQPERPRRSVEIGEIGLSVRTFYVGARGDLQRALDAAQPGDTIMLEAGATFTGPFTLPRKTGSGWIVLQTSAIERLPELGTRVSPADAVAMPTLEAATGSVLVAEPGAHHFRLIGLHIRPRAGVFLHNLVVFGSNERSFDELPHHIIVDRCYLHGDPRRGTRRGIAMNSRDTAVVGSYLADFKETGADAQAIASWNGAGPFRIENNYLEASGENLLFGGADPSIAELVPADIEVRHNHFFKPLTWRIDDPSYAGTPWMVKNHLELKNARRVLIDGNLFEQAWEHAQTGTSIVLTVRNQGGGAPWSTVEDVTFANNVVRHAGSGLGMHGWDDVYPSRQTERILIRNNLFVDISGARWGGAGRLFAAFKGIEGLVIDHNTGLQDGAILVAEGGTHTRFVYRNNIALHNASGVKGAGTAAGLETLETYFPGHVFARNVLVGGDPARYPASNFFPASLNAVGFVDPSARNYVLSAMSPYKNRGTDGTDIGVDFDALEEATAGVTASSGRLKVK